MGVRVKSSGSEEIISNPLSNRQQNLQKNQGEWLKYQPFTLVFICRASALAKTYGAHPNSLSIIPRHDSKSLLFIGGFTGAAYGIVISFNNSSKINRHPAF